jgi:hypothetical protein
MSYKSRVNICNISKPSVALENEGSDQKREAEWQTKVGSTPPFKATSPLLEM